MDNYVMRVTCATLWHAWPWYDLCRAAKESGNDPLGSHNTPVSTQSTVKLVQNPLSSTSLILTTHESEHTRFLNKSFSDPTRPLWDPEVLSSYYHIIKPVGKLVSIGFHYSKPQVNWSTCISLIYIIYIMHMFLILQIRCGWKLVVNTCNLQFVNSNCEWRAMLTRCSTISIPHIPRFHNFPQTWQQVELSVLVP